MKEKTFFFLLSIWSLVCRAKRKLASPPSQLGRPNLSKHCHAFLTIASLFSSGLHGVRAVSDFDVLARDDEGRLGTD
jgi:hypothetical protein